MDGLNVNKKLECELATALNERSNTAFLKLGSSSLHKVHSAYRKGIKKLKFDLDQFFYDVHYFLNFPALSGKYNITYCSVCHEAFIYTLVIHEVCGSPNIGAMG